MTQRKMYEAAEVLSRAKTLVITAGAGVGVDSGLPDFRGSQGFWQAYPMYRPLGINFVDAANPLHFEQNPAFGWGFYGHRTRLYRHTTPHPGFALLRDWIERYGLHSFVITSNVDGQFQKARLPEEGMLEVHGSIHHLQCTVPCSNRIWPNDQDLVVDYATMQSQNFPCCPHCGAVARPNILMFGDYAWLSERSAHQQQAFECFLSAAEKPLLVIELGAGTALPTIRRLSERLVRHDEGRLVRINPRESEVPAGQISLACGALEGLQGMEAVLRRNLSL